MLRSFLSLSSCPRRLARPGRSLLALGLALCALCAGVPAAAQDEARVLYQKGNAAFKQGDDILARHYYEQSLELEESFDTRCNLGRAEAVSKLWRPSYFNLGVCLKLYPEDAELAGVRDKYAALRGDVKAELEEATVAEVDAEVAAFGTEATENEASEKAETRPAPAPQDPEPASPPEPVVRRNEWKLPVVLSLATAGMGTSVAGGILLGSSAALKKESNDFVDEVGEDGCAGPSPAEGCAINNDRLTQSDRRFNTGLALAAVGGGLMVTSLVVLLAVPREVEVGAVALRPVAQLGAPGGGWRLGVSGQF